MGEMRQYRAGDIPVQGRAALTTNDRGETLNPAPGDRAAWRDWVSASKTRNWLRRDPLLDWLHAHGAAKGFVKDEGADAVPPSPYDLTALLFRKGSEFEEGIFRLLEPKVASHTVIGGGWEAALRLEAAVETFEAMRAGVEMIEQAVVRNPEDRTYGSIDLLVRSDALERLVPGTLGAGETEAPAPGLASDDGAVPPWHYVVIDVKFSTLDITTSGLASNAHRHYAGQVLVYTAAVARIQGYCPPDAFLLGRNWVNQKQRGAGALERLGRVPVEREATRDGALPLVDDVARAIEWMRLVRAEGASWDALPRPTRPELYPNLGSGEDAPWSSAKSKIAREIGELTALPGVGPELRDAAIAKGIMRRDTGGLTPELLGVGGDVRPRRLALVLEANSPERVRDVAAHPERAVIPERIALPPDQEQVWRAPWKLEFCVDFENTQNLDDDFRQLPAVGGNVCIFQVGCLVQVDGRPPTASEIAAAQAAGAVAGHAPADGPFGQWTASRLSLSGEREVLDGWRAYMDAWRRSLGLDWSAARIIHWSPAEPNLLSNSYNCAADRHPDWRLPEELGWFDALDQLVHRVPVGVTGAWGFGLKSIAKAMHQAGLIATVWSDGPADGLGAMAAAYEAEHRAASTSTGLTDYDFIRAVAAYNEVDCRAMAEVLSWLRANR